MTACRKWNRNLRNVGALPYIPWLSGNVKKAKTAEGQCLFLVDGGEALC